METLTERKRNILYHYTTQQGLLGIIENRVIWASGIFYLNDSTEYDRPRAMTQVILNKHWREVGEGPEDDGIESPRSGREHRFCAVSHIQVMLDASEEKNTTRIYVTSFSRRGDQLSQWRGYSTHGQGFSIGFDKKKLVKQLGKVKPCRFDKCLYKKVEQQQQLQSAIKDAIDRLEATLREKIPDLDGLSRDVWDKVSEAIEVPSIGEVLNLLFLIPRIKNEKFDEEKEWRSVFLQPLSTPSPDAPTVKFRPGNSMLIPYIEIPLSDEDPNNKDKRLPIGCIKEIIVGPTPHRELSKRSVEQLLKANGIENCPVTNSGIPYRPV